MLCHHPHPRAQPLQGQTHAGCASEIRWWGSHKSNGQKLHGSAAATLEEEMLPVLQMAWCCLEQEQRDAEILLVMLQQRAEQNCVQLAADWV